MGAAVGLSFAVGLLLLVQAVVSPKDRSSAPRRRRSAAGIARDSARAATVGVLTAGAVLVVTGIPMVALLGGAAGAAAPAIMHRRRRRAAEQARRQAWPDAIDDILTAVRAGVPLPEALCAAATNGPEPLRPGFAAYASAWRRGCSFNESLAALQRQFDDAEADRVAISLSLVAAAGGRNVGRVLATQSDFLRTDLRMRGEIESRQSWTVNAARVAVAAPWLAVAALSIRGEAVDAYASVTGAAVLLVTAIVGAGSYWAMTRIGALPRPARLPDLVP